MARDIAIWDSDQVFHFLSTEHVSTRVRQLLLDAGLDGDMLLTFDKQDYIELEIGLKVAEIQKLIKVKNKLVEEMVSKTMDKEEVYQSDSDTEGKEKDKDLEALQGQEEMNEKQVTCSGSTKPKSSARTSGGEYMDEKLNTEKNLRQHLCEVEPAFDNLENDPAVVACKRIEFRRYEEYFPEEELGACLSKSNLKHLPPDFYFLKSHFPECFFKRGSKNFRKKITAGISWSLE